MGHFFSDMWFLKHYPHTVTCDTSFILASWKDPWVSRKVLILTACSAKQVRCPFFSIDSDASYDSGTVCSLQTILFLRNLCGLTFLLQIEMIHGVIRFCTHSKISLHLSNFECHAISRVYPSKTIQAFPARTRTSLEAGENLTIWHHKRLTIPAELWGHITQMHFGAPLRIVPGWWDDRKRIYEPMLPLYLRLDISNNLSCALSCLRLSGHNFLVQSCVITGIEGLQVMSSGFVTNVTGTLFRMRNTICWTVRMNILLAFAHAQHRQLVF